MKHFLTNIPKGGRIAKNILFASHTIRYTLLCVISYSLLILSGCQSNDEKISQLYRTGRNHWLAQQPDSAAFYYAEAEKLITGCTAPLLQAKVYFEMGSLVQRIQDYEGATAYFQKAFEAYRQAGNKRMQAYVLTEIGNDYLWADESNTSAALRHYRDALAINPDDTTKCVILLRIGDFYKDQGEPDSAQLYLRKALAYPCFANEHSLCLAHIGQLHHRAGQLDSARYYFSEALQRNPSIYQQQYCFGALKDIALQQEDTVAAEYYAQQYAHYADSLSRRRFRLSKKLYDVKSEKVETLEQEQARSNAWLWVASGVVAVLAAGTWLAVHAYRLHRKRAEKAWEENKELHEQNEQLVDRNLRLADRNKNLAARNARLAAALEQEKRQRETYAQLKQQMLQAYRTERNRSLEQRLQQLKAQLDAACEPASQHPVLSPGYKQAILDAYAQVLHWDKPRECLTLFDEQFDRIATRAEQWCVEKPSGKHAAARLCCLLLVDTLKIHAEILMDYRKDSYERMLSRLQQHTGNATEQDFRLALYRDVFLDTSHPTEPMAD